METKTNVIRYYVLQATEVICLSPTPFSLRDLGLAAGDVEERSVVWREMSRFCM